MAKYRVVKVIDQNENLFYLIEKRRFLFFWCKLEMYQKAHDHLTCGWLCKKRSPCFVFTPKFINVARARTWLRRHLEGRKYDSGEKKIVTLKTYPVTTPWYL